MGFKEAAHAHLHDELTDGRKINRKIHSNERLGWLAPARQLKEERSLIFSETVNYWTSIINSGGYALSISAFHYGVRFILWWCSTVPVSDCVWGAAECRWWKVWVVWEVRQAPVVQLVRKPEALLCIQKSRVLCTDFTAKTDKTKQSREKGGVHSAPMAWT